MKVERVFEEIRGHQFYRGVNVVLTLREMGEVYSQSKIGNKYICQTLAELGEYAQIKWIDMEIGGISNQFMNQWHGKVLAGAGSYGDFMNTWNEGTRYSVDQYMISQEHENYYDVEEYRKWVFRKVDSEFGDVVFSFWVGVDFRED